MQTLTLSQFVDYIKQQQDILQFDNIVDQTLFFLQQRFDMTLLLEFSTYFINFQLQLSIKQKFSGIELYQPYLSNLSNSMRIIIIQFGENLFIESLISLINQQQIPLKNIKSITQTMLLYPDLLKKQEQIKKLLSYLIISQPGSEQVRFITASMFIVCKLEQILNYLVHKIQINPNHIFLFQYLESYPQHMKLFFDQLLHCEKQSKMLQIISNLEYFLVDDLHEYKNTQKAFLTSFAQSITSSNFILRRNSLLFLAYFPISQTDQNVIITQLNFLQNALEDTNSHVRAAAAGTASKIIQKFKDIPNKNTLIQLLFQNAFDADNVVRKNSLQALLAITINTDKQTENLLKINIEKIENLLYDTSSIRSTALKLYIQLLQNQTIQPQTNILKLLNDPRIGKKLKISALFPQGSTSFVNQPDLCYKQIFLALKNCRNLIIPLLQELVDKLDPTLHSSQIAICGSISAILGSIFIEIPDFDVLKIAVLARQKIVEIENGKQRKVNEAVNSALQHSLKPFVNSLMEGKITKLFKAIKSAEMICLMRIVQNWVNFDFQVEVRDFDSVQLLVDDNTVNNCIDLLIQDFDFTDASVKVKQWYNCLEVIGDLEDYKVVVGDINIRTTLVKFVDYLRLSTEEQKMSNIFSMLNRIDIVLDPFLIDSDKLLTIVIDIYLNQVNFNLTISQTESLQSFIQNTLDAYSKLNPFCQVILTRIDKTLEDPNIKRLKVSEEVQQILNNISKQLNE